MEKCFAWLGRVVFPRHQAWEQRRNAKLFFGVVAFSLALGAVVWLLLRLIYNKTMLG